MGEQSFLQATHRLYLIYIPIRFMNGNWVHMSLIVTFNVLKIEI